MVKNHFRAVRKFNREQDMFHSYIVAKEDHTDQAFGYSSPKRPSTDEPAAGVQDEVVQDDALPSADNHHEN